jgi:hypothetical protein
MPAPVNRHQPSPIGSLAGILEVKILPDFENILELPPAEQSRDSNEFGWLRFLLSFVHRCALLGGAEARVRNTRSFAANWDIARSTRRARWLRLRVTSWLSP